METKEEKKPEEKKGFFKKLKESVDDREEQMMLLSTFVRLGILIWSGGILTLAYVKLPPAFNIPEQKLDPTFIASVFTGVLATFGIQTARKNGDGTFRANNSGSVSVSDMERLIAVASQTAPAQTIRIEQAPLTFTTRDDKGEPPVKPTL
tara:strand:- start:210 stop:659 length:450 start_codon:yes stop_codon:yes gene_type:complete